MGRDASNRTGSIVRRTLNQGDIVQITLDPTLGTEIRGRRPALVMSNSEFNRCGRVMLAPITQGSFDRVRGWAVTLMGAGTKTQGAAVVSQCRTVDIEVREIKRIEAAPTEVIEDALAKLQAAIGRT